MNEEVRSLLDALRKGSFDDPDEKIELLGAALREDPGTTIDFLVGLLRAEQAVVRAAAVLGCKGRKERPLLEALKLAAQDEEERVRLALAKILKPLPDWSMAELLAKLCRDRQQNVRLAALRASAGEAEFLQVQLEAVLASSWGWGGKESAVEVLIEQSIPEIVPALFQVIARESDDDVQRPAAERLEKLLVEGTNYLEKIPTEIQLLGKVERVVRELREENFPRLLEVIRSRTQAEVSPEELKEFGADLTASALAGSLPKTYECQEVTQKLAEILTGQKARSIVLLGEPGVGKTALVHDLVCWLARPENGGWRVLRIAPADFLMGTLYMGEWETRVKNLVGTIKRPRRVILYIPNIGELPGIGRHSKSEHNVFTALLPLIKDGSLIVLGESTPNEYEKGFALVPAGVGALEQVLLLEAELEPSRRILRQLRDQSGSGLSDPQLEQILELSDQFILTQARPGKAVRLFQNVHAAELNSTAPVTTRQILQALSSSTGLPVDLLDDEVPLDLSATRAFFEQRVLGQPEAVEAVLDLVTLIKAGLTDPNKPMGVFLFIGPTGVGKTELARALAEYIFGDAKRLLRFDMSEFAEAAGFQRLIGSEGKGVLTDAVRQQPFSVVLLDEIEKSHVNVFDLCLQLFDAGRLTDGQGRTTDFRRTILVLTSNVGAAKPLVSPIGFKNNGVAEGDGEQQKEQTMRELSMVFRPEFLNRIDRIVHFRPLALDVAENIARKEVELVLGRSGIKRRNITVEVDSSAVALLVREGYSPHFGARPLKRAVERLLLIPLARFIASGRMTNAAVVRLAGNGGKVEVQTISRRENVTAAAPLKVPGTLQERIAVLEKKMSGIAERAAEFECEKSQLLERTHAAQFYQDSRGAAQVFDSIHRIEQFLSFEKRLQTGLERFTSQLKKSRGTPTGLDRQLKELEALFGSAQVIVGSNQNEELSDALIEMSVVSSSGEAVDALAILYRMYSGYARQHRLALEILGESGPQKQRHLYLSATGMGACALFRAEVGLHEFEQTRRIHAARTGREVIRCNRELLRVEIWQLVEEPPKEFLQQLKEKAKTIEKREGSLIQGRRTEVSLFHSGSMRSLQGVFSGERNTAFARARAILASQVAQGSATLRSEPSIIRRYELGIGSRAKDLRSSHSTTHLDRLFRGHLELLQD